MKFLLCLASLVAAAAAAALDVDVKFSQASINVMDSNRLINTIQVQLTKAPINDAVVYLQAPTLRFSACTLFFTTTNWNKPQSVTVFPAPFFPPLSAKGQPNGGRPAETITAQIQVNCACLYPDTSDQKVIVNYQTHAGATCTSYGDPHFKTFDGKVYNFQGLGDYYLVKSPRLEVQARQTRYYGGAATINTQLVVRFQRTVLAFSTGPLYKGQPTLTLRQLAYDNRDNIQIATANAQSYTLTFFDGSSIKIVVNDPGSKYYNVDVNLSGYFFNQGVSGLCGNFNGNAGDDVPSGGSEAEIPAASNFITMGNTVPIPNFEGTPAVPQGAGVCAFPIQMPAPPAVTPETVTPPAKGYGSVPAGSLGPFAPVAPVDKNVPTTPAGSLPALVTSAEAAAHCAAVLNVAGCAAYVDPASYQTSCVADAVASGGLNAVEATRIAYRSQCKTASQTVANSGTDADKKAAAATLAALENAAGTGPWRCFPGIFTPIRMSQSGNPECMSANGRDCFWSSSDATCDADRVKNPYPLVPLTCGQPHLLVHGITGYESEPHWCSKSRNLFEPKAKCCNGRGSCVDGGCLCNIGYTGPECGTDITSKCHSTAAKAAFMAAWM